MPKIVVKWKSHETNLHESSGGGGAMNEAGSQTGFWISDGKTREDVGA